MATIKLTLTEESYPPNPQKKSALERLYTNVGNFQEPTYTWDDAGKTVTIVCAKIPPYTRTIFKSIESGRFSCFTDIEQ